MTLFPTGSQIRFEATRDGERRVFVLKHISTATGDPYRLHGYDPDRNELNKLESYGPPKTDKLKDHWAKAKGRIRFYLGDGWDIDVVGGPS